MIKKLINVYLSQLNTARAGSIIIEPQTLDLQFISTFSKNNTLEETGIIFNKDKTILIKGSKGSVDFNTALLDDNYFLAHTHHTTHGSSLYGALPSEKDYFTLFTLPGFRYSGFIFHQLGITVFINILGRSIDNDMFSSDAELTKNACKEYFLQKLDNPYRIIPWESIHNKWAATTPMFTILEHFEKTILAEGLAVI